MKIPLKSYLASPDGKAIIKEVTDAAHRVFWDALESAWDDIPEGERVKIEDAYDGDKLELLNDAAEVIYPRIFKSPRASPDGKAIIKEVTDAAHRVFWDALESAWDNVPDAEDGRGSHDVHS